MKKFLTLALSAVMTLTLLAGCGDSGTPAGSGSNAPAGGNLIFPTGGEPGPGYAFGGVLAADVPAQLGFCQSDVMAYAYNGTSTFADTGAYTGFSTVANLYMEQVQIVTCNPDIKTVADLAGKKVSVGAAGSGVYFNAVDILSAYGLGALNDKGEFTQIIANYQSFGDSADSLTDGTIDAAFIVAGAPTNAISSLATTKDVYLVSLDDAHIDTLLAASPYYSKTTIPADTYPGTPEATTVAVGAVVIARDDVSEDDIYNFVSDIYENAANLSHGKDSEVDVSVAARVTAVPYHPGAAKYFAEKGITVPTK